MPPEENIEGRNTGGQQEMPPQTLAEAPQPGAAPPPLPPPPPCSLPRAQPLPPESKRRGCGWWILGAVAVVIFGIALILLLAALRAASGMEGAAARGSFALIEETLEGTGPEKIVLVPVAGFIGTLPSVLGGDEDTVAMVKEMLSIAENDSSVKGILLYVDSPGGGITASDVIRHDLVEFRDRTRKPIVGLLGDVAASGGYYVASSSDYIIAHPTTLTGSIGVIMPLFGIEGLMGKIGVESRTIKSGPMKDMGSMTAPLTPETREILQKLTDEYQKRFVDMVHEGMRRRGVQMTREQLLQYTDGRVFSGEQAVKAGFVDRTGYYEDALAVARKKANAQENCRVVTYRRRPGLMELLFARAAAKPAEVTLKIDGMPKMESRFLYLWAPGE